MTLPKRDTLIAILLLLLYGLLFWASFDIRSPDYGTLAPAAWPRAVLSVLTVFCLIYFAQSLRGTAFAIQEGAPPGGGLGGWLRHYRNPLWCYGIYFLFLATLPVLGSLIGGILLIFLLLSVIGGFGRRQLLLHGAVAVIAMGAMWSLFTFGLRVILPQGEIFTTL